VGLCQLESRLECKCFCAANAEVGGVSHEQLATRDNGGQLEEQEPQGQQRLQKGAKKTGINGAMCSRTWEHGAGNLKLKWQFILEQP